MTSEAPELLPCPFCGGEGEIVDAIEAGEQAKVVCCRKCMASSRVIFALMDDVTLDLVSAWNTRHDRALIREREAAEPLVELLEKAPSNPALSAEENEQIASLVAAYRKATKETDNEN